jgi:hypothetical protein
MSKGAIPPVPLTAVTVALEIKNAAKKLPRSEKFCTLSYKIF